MGDDSSLTPHVGHKVEIAGSLQPMTAGATAGGRTLVVSSVRMIANKCD